LSTGGGVEERAEGLDKPAGTEAVLAERADDMHAMAKRAVSQIDLFGGERI